MDRKMTAVMLLVVIILISGFVYLSSVGMFSIIPGIQPWGKPDFVANNLQVPTVMYTGNPYLVNFTIYNNGGDVSVTHQHQLQHNASGSWAYASSQNFDSHKGKTTRVVSFIFTPTVAGTYFLRGCADATASGCNPPGLIDESNEKNNIYYKKITVLQGGSNATKPDLTVSSITFYPPSPSLKGTTINITANISNIGNDTAYSFSVELRMWDPGGSIYKITSQDISSLLSGESKILIYPWYTNNVTAGVWAIRIQADSKNVINEWNENNNYGYANYTLT